MQAYTLSLMPIHPDSNAVRAYEYCRQALLGLLESLLAMTWTTMSLYRIAKPGLPKIAVAVMVRPYTKADWGDLVSRFSQLLEEACVALHVPSQAPIAIKVEFIPGSFHSLKSKQEKKRRIGYERHWIR